MARSRRRKPPARNLADAGRNVSRKVKGKHVRPSKESNDAYAEATRRIEKARRLRIDHLTFEDLPELTRLPSMKQLGRLRSLKLRGTKVSDLTEVVNLTALQDLELWDTPVSDISPLAQLTSLANLDLDGTLVRDLRPLRKLSELRVLYLRRTRVTDLSPLSKMQSLRILSVEDTVVSDLTPISDLSKLSVLKLNRSSVSNLAPLVDAVEMVRGTIFGNWEGLSFDDCPIDDPVLREIAKKDKEVRTLEAVNHLRRQQGLPLLTEESLLQRQEEELTGPVFEQRPSSHNFFFHGGRLEARPQISLPTDTAVAQEIHGVVREKLAKLLDRLSRSNTPTRIVQSLNRLNEALGQAHDDLRPGALLMGFRSIEADAASYDTEQGRSELFPDALSMISDLASSVEDLMACYPQIADIESARLALRLQQADVPKALENMRAVKLAAMNSDFVGRSAIEALESGEHEIESASVVVEAEADDVVIAEAIRARSAIAAQMLLDYRNFTARVVRRVVSDLQRVGAQSWDAAIEAFPKGIGKGVEKVSAGLVIGSVSALVSSLAGPLAGLAVLVASFRPLADKAQELGRRLGQDQDGNSRSNGKGTSADRNIGEK